MRETSAPEKPARAVKFRVWDHLEKRYIYPDSGYQGHYVLSLSGIFTNLQTGSGGSECVVEEFTGLQDMEGRDIYEGDIVEFSDEDWSTEPVKGVAEVLMVTDLLLVESPQWCLWLLGDEDPRNSGLHRSMRGKIRVLPETALQRSAGLPSSAPK